MHPGERFTIVFATAVDRLPVENTGVETDFEIAVPRSAPWVEVLVGEVWVFLKDGSRIVTAASVDARGRSLLPLTGASR